MFVIRELYSITLRSVSITPQLNSDKVDKADKANVKWIITGIDTSAKIIFSNCSEITKKVDKLACLLFGNSNGTTVLSVIRVRFSAEHVDEVIPINFGDLNLTTSLEWYGFTLNNLNAEVNDSVVITTSTTF